MDESEAPAPNGQGLTYGNEGGRLEKEYVVFNVKLPDGFHLNPNAPQRYEIVFPKESKVRVEVPSNRFDKLPLTVPFESKTAGLALFTAKLNIYYCREDNTGVCYIKTISWKVPVRFSKGKGSSKTIKLTASIK